MNFGQMQVTDRLGGYLVPYLGLTMFAKALVAISAFPARDMAHDHKYHYMKDMKDLSKCSANGYPVPVACLMVKLDGKVMHRRNKIHASCKIVLPLTGRATIG